MRNRGRGSVGVGIVLIALLLSVLPVRAAPNTARGYEINNSGYDGLRAVMSTGAGTGSPPSFTFALKSPDVFQYFAEQLHPKNSCLQANVVHQRVVGSGATTHQLVISNWCASYTFASGTFTFDLTNATFRSSYVRTITFNDTGTSFQDEVIDVRIYQTNAGTNRWDVYLYNYSTSTYDAKAAVAGLTVSQPTGYADIGDGGYTQDPTMSCPTLYGWGILEVRGIQKRVSGTWSYIGAGDITFNIADSWPCLTTNNYQERISNPAHFKIETYGVTY